MKVKKKIVRKVDDDTAEGHRKVARLDEVTEDGKRAATIRRTDALDDVAEGHRRMP